MKGEKEDEMDEQQEEDERDREENEEKQEEDVYRRGEEGPECEVTIQTPPPGIRCLSQREREELTQGGNLEGGQLDKEEGRMGHNLYKGIIS